MNISFLGKEVDLFNSMKQVLQNSDSLFDHQELSACPSEKSERFNSAVFVFKPSTETFEKLIETSKINKGEYLHSILLFI